MSRLALLAFVLAPLAVACDKESEEADNDGPGAGTMPHCEDTVSAMTPDEESTFGLLGQDFLNRIPADVSGVATFEGASSSGMEMSLRVDVASLRAVASVEAPIETDGPVPAIAIYCDDRIEVDAQLELFTDDGQLAERFSVVLVSTEGTNPDMEADDVFFSLALEDSFEGTMAVEDFVDVDGYDTISVSISGGFVDQAFLGEVMATGEVQSGSMVTVDRIPMVTLESYPMED
jgi:hypothetical protein